MIPENLFQILDMLGNKGEHEFNMTEYRLKGYRAYTLGGRTQRLYSNKLHIPIDTSIEPFDYLTDEQKKEWWEGVEYAKKERNECRSLVEGVVRFKIARKMAKQGISANEISEKTGINVKTAKIYLKRYNNENENKNNK